KAQRKIKSKAIADANKLNRFKAESIQYDIDPILGKPGNKFIARIMAAINEPYALSMGYERKEVEKLLYGAQESILSRISDSLITKEDILAEEENKRQAISRILNIKNTSTPDLKKLAINLAVDEFKRADGDTGSSEVQAAVLTIKIIFKYNHMKKFKNDFANIRGLGQLVQERQKTLKYLKKNNPEQYFYVIEKLGLTDRAVTTEFNLSKEYMQNFKIYGDRVLVKRSNKEIQRQRKIDKKLKK
ncbi:mitochondrial 37S ribosomal protein uS15m, partial [Ascoidea rubescens DSM 1968]